VSVVFKSSWGIVGKDVKKVPKLCNPILIEGLPGIANVGKVAVDLIVEKGKAKKLFDFVSLYSPNYVSVNHVDNLVYPPSISLFLKKGKGKKGRDILLLVGDFQPIDPRSCYDFCFSVVGLLKSLGVKEVITLAGMGTDKIPKSPSIFCTGSSASYVKKCVRGTKILTDVSSLVAITGVSGVLLGVCSREKIDSACFLVETFADPRYVGIKEGRDLVRLINKKFDAGVNLSKIDKEIGVLEKRAKESSLSNDFSGLSSLDSSGKVKYIG